MRERYDIAVIGGGHAAVALVSALRAGGYPGSVAVFSDELVPPYERPPLSKTYLTHATPLEFREAAFWEAKAIDLHLDSHVASIDVDRRVLQVEDGPIVAFERLVLATGGRARRLTLPGDGSEEFHYVKTRDDVDALRETLGRARSYGVLGGGYIGLETAAVLRGLGKQVTVFEAQPRVLARVSGAHTSYAITELHRSNGVDVHVGAHVSAAHRAGLGIELVIDGERAEFDCVIAGVGLALNTELAEAAGIACDNGVIVDANFETNVPGVFAIGDIARWSTPWGEAVRLESVPNATESANRAADALLGRTLNLHAGVPWFWSHQFNMKIQTAGILAGYDEEIPVVDGDGNLRLIRYYKAGELIAADALNAPREFVAIKRELAQARRYSDRAMTAA